MADLRLERDGRDVASFTLANLPSDETPQVEIGGTWHDLTQDEDDDAVWSIHVHGPDCTDPESGSVEVALSGKLLRIGVDDVIRTAGRVYLV